MKTVKKISKKAFKPAYIVDFTNANDPIDWAFEIAMAKVAASIPVTYDDVNSIIASTIYNIPRNKVTISIVDTAEKKPGLLKRLWNRITGKKN